jgi:hypothetical protein
MPSIRTSILAVVRRLWSCLAPLRDRVEPIQVVADLCHRSRRELVVENATLRHQLSVLRRTGGRPRLGLTDRLRLLVSAALLPAWRKAIVVVQPETILKWHRAGFRLFWRHRSKPGNRARLNADIILSRSRKVGRVCSPKVGRGSGMVESDSGELAGGQGSGDVGGDVHAAQEAAMPFLRKMVLA